MKKVNAKWEKRNLGVNCNEITVEQCDDLKVIKKHIEKQETDYTVIKVPAGMSEVYFYLQSIGYCFIEVLIKCHHELKTPTLNRIQEKIMKSIKHTYMNKNDKEFLFNKIREGMFKNDRISIDPNFSIEQANYRYINWINSEIENQSRLFKLEYKNKSIGFFLLKEINKKTYSGVIAGIFPEFQNVGFGLSMNYFQIVESANNNARVLMSSYSLNNLGARAIHNILGYKNDEYYYVFIKHKL